MTRYNFNLAGMAIYYFNKNIRIILRGIRRSSVIVRIPQTIQEKAEKISKKKKKSAIKKIEQVLGDEGINKRSFGGFFRGKNIRARLKMGQVSYEAVKYLEKKKIDQVIKNNSFSPEIIEMELQKTLGEKTKKSIKAVGEKIKSGAKNLYENTSEVAGKVVSIGIKHPGLVICNTITTAAPFAFSAATCAAIQGATSATHIGTGLGLTIDSLIGSIPVKKTQKDPNTGEKLRDYSGKLIKKKIPASKVLGRWGRKAERRIEDVFEGKGIKGSVKRMAEKIKESHHACHPQD